VSRPEDLPDHEGSEPDVTAPYATVADQPYHLEKVKQTLRARLALAGGYALHELSDGSLVVTRWDMSRRCADLRQVADFIRHVEGAQ
jgi:hypothetical protein